MLQYVNFFLQLMCFNRDFLNQKKSWIIQTKQPRIIETLKTHANTLDSSEHQYLWFHDENL